MIRIPVKLPDEHLARVRAMPCLACEAEHVIQPLPTTAHHIVAQSYRRLTGEHESVIPLCRWHHLGEPRISMSAQDMAKLYGPSLAKNKRAFVERYGTEQSLLAQIGKRLTAAAN